MTFRVVCARPVDPEWRDFLAAEGVALSAPARDGSRADFVRRAAGADGILSFLNDPVDGALISSAPRLAVIANVAVGFDNIDCAEAARRGIAVTHTPGCLDEAVADLTWGLILAAARRIVEADRFVRSGRFRGWAWDAFCGMELAGRTLGIAGFGGTGRAVARRAAGFGMRLAVLERAGMDLSGFPGIRPCSLDALLARSDVLTLHVPLTGRTRHLVGRREIARMKPGAILVNVSRGPVVDEKALVGALAAGRLSAAALDVYEREPALAPGLAGLPNVVLTPHIGSATTAARRRMMRMACENILAVARGEPPPNPVPTGPRRGPRARWSPPAGRRDPASRGVVAGRARPPRRSAAPGGPRR